MTSPGLSNLVALAIQATGALLLATLCLVLQQTVRREPLGYWSAGWFALAAALLSLLAAFEFPELGWIGESLYVVGEYAFAYLVVVGCRRLVTGRRPRRIELWLFLPAVGLAILLPWSTAGHFDAFFPIHTLIYAGLFVLSLRVLRRRPSLHGGVTGLRVMKVALLLLALDYLHYSVVYVLIGRGAIAPGEPYLVYSPLYDLLCLVLLAFGMLMVTTGEVQHELEVANTSLAQARDRLEAMAQLDHLTSALNRHAFDSIVEDAPPGRGNRLRGCAAVADIDGLKAINDRYGHAAGDATIRAVATGLRSCIRADDLLFRWGGDEFLILFIGVGEPEARSRLGAVNVALRQSSSAGVPEDVGVSVSIGYAPFDGAASLDEVIAEADTAMYQKKRAGRNAG